MEEEVGCFPCIFMLEILDYAWWLVAGDFVLAAIALFALPKWLEEKSMGEVSRELIMRQPRGFIFGKKGRKWVGRGEEKDGHILVLGGSGAGKTSCLAIPSLLSWRARVFAVDIKGELYQKTRWLRREIKAFNPADECAYGYNPFYILDQSENLVLAARQIVLALIALAPDARDPFWAQAAQNLFTGAILHFYQRGYSFIATVEKILDLPPADLVAKIARGKNPLACRYINQFLGMDVKTLAGVYAELANKLAVFATDAQLKNVLTRSRYIRPDDLEEGSDIYLIIPEEKLEAWQGLMSLIINQFLRHFERRGEGAGEPILFLLDEFPRLGKVEAVKGLATLRSKKVTICLLVQSLAQLDMIYGRSYRQVIADNCAYKAVLNATDAETQEYFSRLVGTKEQERMTETINYSEQTEDISGHGTSKTTIDQRFIKPEKFATLREIVLLSPFGVGLVTKAPYFKMGALGC